MPIQLKYQLDDFSAAHRLVKGYQGPCAHLHGHTYQTFIEITANDLQQYDMVVDFAEIKRICNNWVQNQMDHGTLVSTEDPSLLSFVRDHQQKHYVFPEGENTTAECLSRVIFSELKPLLATDPNFGQRCQLTGVTVFESKRASATYME